MNKKAYKHPGSASSDLMNFGPLCQTTASSHESSTPTLRGHGSLPSHNAMGNILASTSAGHCKSRGVDLPSGAVGSGVGRNDIAAGGDDHDDDDLHHPGSKLRAMFKHSKKYTSIHGLTVVAHYGDIVKVPCDVIVTSEYPFSRKASTVTRALFNVTPGGGCFKRRWEKICHNKPLEVGKVYAIEMADVAGFPYRYVLHVVIDPRYSGYRGGGREGWTHMLDVAFRTAVCEADELYQTSVVMPLLGAGMSGNPQEVAERAIITLKDVQPRRIKTAVIATLDAATQTILQQFCEYHITVPQEIPTKFSSPSTTEFPVQKNSRRQALIKTNRDCVNGFLIPSTLRSETNHLREVTNKEGRFCMPSDDSGDDDDDDDDDDDGVSGACRGAGGGKEKDGVREITNRAARMSASSVERHADYRGSPGAVAMATGIAMDLPPIKASIGSISKVEPQEEEQHCPICMDEMTNVKTLDKCGHKFCKDCIENSFRIYKPICPSCQMFYGINIGNMPKDAQLQYSIERFPSLPGYEKCGTIILQYSINDGIQTKEHPNPGRGYSGTNRCGFLPDNKEGRTVLSLLLLAFERRLTFTVGRSVTTGCDNVVVWNDIHHKTCTDGGPTRYGYPDDTYLSRVKEELASKGVTEDQLERKHKDLKTTDVLRP